MAKRKFPLHGEWKIVDHTLVNDGYELLRYCAVLPYMGWHKFGHFDSYKAALKAQKTQFDAVGNPWPTIKEDQ